MLQQTRVEAVIPYYERFLEKYPDVVALANSLEPELLKVWEGLGYYSRVRNMRKCAVQIVEEHNGRFPEEFDELIKLPGIGPYTAGAISSIAFDKSEPAVDGNFYRVYSRLFADGRNISEDKAKKEIFAIAKTLVPKENAGVFNQAIMDVGATLCVPNGQPLCGRCPVADECLAHKQSQETDFPVKKTKAPRKNVEKTVFVLKTSEGYLGYKNENRGLLAELYQLPDTEGHIEIGDLARELGNLQMIPVSEIDCYHVKHIFTHIEWHMRVYAMDIQYERLPAGWIVMDPLLHPLPTAYKKCIQ